MRYIMFQKHICQLERLARRAGGEGKVENEKHGPSDAPSCDINGHCDECPFFRGFVFSWMIAWGWRKIILIIEFPA
jgi:hypothetical protein